MKPDVFKLIHSDEETLRSFGWYQLWVNLIFVGISLPFIWWTTVKSVFKGNVTIQSPNYFLDVAGLFFNVQTFNLCIIFLAMTGFGLSLFWGGRFVELGRLCLFYVVAGFYMSFWYFGTDLYANGTSLPILVFTLMIIAFPSRKQLFSPSGPDPRSLQLVGLAVVAMFFASGLSKLTELGWVWTSSENIRNIMLYRYLFVDHEIAKTIAEWPFLCSALGVVVLLFELAGGLMLLLLRNGSRIYGSCFLLFLLGTWCLLGIDEFIALFLPFVPVFFLPVHSVSAWRRIFLWR